MRTYKFALLPSNGSVAAGVIIIESPAERFARASQHKPAAVSVSASLPTTTAKPVMKRA